MASAALIALSPLLLRAGDAEAQVHLTQGEALRLAFPEPAEIERRTAFLTDEELERARELAGPDVEVSQAVVTYYIGSSDDEALGVAYFDSHRVRTLPEVLMIVVTPESRIGRIEVMRFAEPPEYAPPEGWLRLFDGHELQGDLATKGTIASMTGATLTSRAVTDASRRVLALHAVIRPLDEGSDIGGP